MEVPMAIAESPIPIPQQTLRLDTTMEWCYETDEFTGICEIAHDEMVVKCVFRSTSKSFYDVLAIDGVIKARLCSPVSVERLAEQLAHDLPELVVEVSGRAATHGWITAKASVSRHNG
jgi:hypothetical protein